MDPPDPRKPPQRRLYETFRQFRSGVQERRTSIETGAWLKEGKGRSNIELFGGSPLVPLTDNLNGPYSSYKPAPTCRCCRPYPPAAAGGRQAGGAGTGMGTRVATAGWTAPPPRAAHVAICQGPFYAKKRSRTRAVALLPGLSIGIIPRCRASAMAGAAHLLKMPVCQRQDAKCRRSSAMLRGGSNMRDLKGLPAIWAGVTGGGTVDCSAPGQREVSVTTTKTTPTGVKPVAIPT